MKKLGTKNGDDIMKNAKNVMDEKSCECRSMNIFCKFLESKLSEEQRKVQSFVLKSGPQVGELVVQISNKRRR